MPACLLLCPRCNDNNRIYNAQCQEILESGAAARYEPKIAHSHPTIGLFALNAAHFSATLVRVGQEFGGRKD